MSPRFGEMPARVRRTGKPVPRCLCGSGRPASVRGVEPHGSDAPFQRQARGSRGVRAFAHPGGDRRDRGRWPDRGRQCALGTSRAGVETSRIEDTGPHGLHGALVNVPARGMTGSRGGTGARCAGAMPPRSTRPSTFTKTTSTTAGGLRRSSGRCRRARASAVYALMIEAGDARDNIPFFVVPPRRTTTAPIAVLVSTFTYTIYANHTRPEWLRDPQWKARWKALASEWGAYPHNPGDHGEYGMSTYNHHSDGSGISIAILASTDAERAHRLHHLSAPGDSGLRPAPLSRRLPSHRVAGGEGVRLRRGHRPGAPRRGRRCPERLPSGHDRARTPSTTRERLWTRSKRIATVEDGCAYLGWQRLLLEGRPVAGEDRGHRESAGGKEGSVRGRRSRASTTTSSMASTGGCGAATDGRRSICPGSASPRRGHYVGSYYRKRPEADHPRVAWMFEGIEDEIFGDHGLGGHGAAGFELDRADKRLGTPAHAVVVASSENHPPDAPWMLVPEEHLTHHGHMARRAAGDS